jgi:plastocyanin domain-containing protein
MKYTCAFLISVLLTLCVVYPIGIVYSQNKTFTAPVINGVQKVDIIGGEYFFIPDHITVKVNIPVELRVWKEKGFIPHNFVINAPEAGIQIRLSLSNTPQAIRFTPLMTGNYPFYCDKKFLFFKSHREKGMKGTLRIIE